MKLYVHLDEACHLIEWDVTDRRTVLTLSRALAQRTQHHLVYDLAKTNGTKLRPSDAVAAVLADGDDLVATPRPRAVPPPAPAADAATGSLSAASDALAATLKPYLKAADEAWEKRHLARAKQIYTELVKVDPSRALPLLRLGLIEHEAGRYAESTAMLERALAADVASPKSPVSPETVPLALARAQLGAGATHEAVSGLKEALRRIPGSKVKARKKLRVQLGRALLADGQRAEGAELLTNLLKEDMEDADALDAYAEASLDLGHADAAIQIYLRLVTARSKDKGVRKRLARALASPGGLEALQSELSFDEATAPALAFLAVIAKDHSALREAVFLLRTASRLLPANSSYALNLAHMHEAMLDNDGALAVVQGFLTANPGLQLDGVRCGAFAEVLTRHQETLPPIWRPGGSGAGAAEPLEPSPPEPSPPETLTLPANAGSNNDDDAGVRPEGSYGEAELELLAMLFTAVKILFVTGHLARAVELVHAIEPVRRVAQLHKTLVRNENAYYTCIARLLSTLPPRPPSALPVLYVVADSHVLSAAWRTLTWRGRETLLVPVLVTGLKVWHLRPASDFFTRANFDAAIEALPDGAPLLFNFGEIDCREGLVLAVEKARYNDLDEAIAAVVSVYVSALVELAAQRGFEILVQPAAPVLDLTRSVVKRFNAALRVRVVRERTLTWLDMADALLSADGESLAEELKFDGTHLNPAYLKMVEGALPK